VDGRIEEKDINFAAINMAAYTPVIGVPGDDALILLACSMFLFPITFVVTIIWTLPGLAVMALLIFLSYSVVIVMLRIEMKKRPRKGIMYEKIYAILTPSAFSVSRPK